MKGRFFSGSAFSLTSFESNFFLLIPWELFIDTDAFISCFLTGGEDFLETFSFGFATSLFGDLFIGIVAVVGVEAIILSVLFNFSSCFAR